MQLSAVEFEKGRAAWRPRGSALGSLSGIAGIPVELEKRTVTGVDVRLKCGARLSDAASRVGVNLPVSMMPLAWAGRKPGCSPKRVSNAWIRSLLSLRIFSSAGRGIGSVNQRVSLCPRRFADRRTA